MGGIGKILTGSPTVVTPATTVHGAVEAMAKNRTGACVVVDDGRLVGLFTERDVMNKVVLKQRDPAKTSVGDVCTTGLITASPDTPEHTALRTMIDNHIRHLPVLDENGGLVGMLSLRKLLQHRVGELSAQLESLHAFITADALGG
ncbi:MAG TPA: CBS domain-containing protein [Polyangia bacterium]|nr:CBS domain-containing protein [Polyangia bacterium]